MLDIHIPKATGTYLLSLCKFGNEHNISRFGTLPWRTEKVNQSKKKNVANEKEIRCKTCVACIIYNSPVLSIFFDYAQVFFVKVASLI